MKNSTNPTEMIRPDFLPFFNIRLKINQETNEMPTIKMEGRRTSFGTNSCMLTEYEKITGKIANKSG